MSNRTIRVNELVQRELSAVLRQHYQTEAVALTITEVRVAPDLRDARVFISVVGDEAMAEQKLRWIRSKATEIRQEVGRRIILKFLPKFEYRLDESTGPTTRMQRLLDEMGPVKGSDPAGEADPTEQP